MVDQLETNFAGLSHGDYIAKVDAIADILASHPRFPQPWPDVVPTPQQLKEQLNGMRRLLTAVVAGDQARASELAAVRAESQQSVVLVGQYLIMVSIKEKDPTLVQNTGFGVKVRTHTKAPDTVSAAPASLSLKHGPASGMAVASAGKVLGAVTYELQVVEGDPGDEQNWRSVGMYRTPHRMQVQGLTEATKCYFRVRGHAANGPGPWSQIASLVII